MPLNKETKPNQTWSLSSWLAAFSFAHEVLSIQLILFTLNYANCECLCNRISDFSVWVCFIPHKYIGYYCEGDLCWLSSHH